jgi:membrane protein
MTTSAGRRRAMTAKSRGRLRDAATVLRGAVSEARADELTLNARALAYSLFLTIPAALIVLLGLFSLFADPASVGDLVDRTRGVIPDEAATLLEQSLQRAAGQTGRGLVLTLAGLGLGAWTTTSAAATLMAALTRAYDRRDERGFVRKRLMALAIVAALAIGAGLVLGLLIFGPYLERWVGGAVGARSLVSWLWWTVQWPLLLLGLLFAFAVVLYLGPDVDERRWRLVTPGAITALITWLVASGGLSVYASHFGSYDKSWGSLSAVVVTLLWLWLTSAALLFGAEVDAEAQRLERRRPPGADDPSA